MKKIYILMIAVLLGGIAKGQWQQCTKFGHPVGCNNFVSADSIIYGYNFNSLYKTSNNGQNWNKINSPFNTFTFNKIAAIGNSICIIMAADNLPQSPELFLSQNKGDTWTYLTNSFPSYIYDYNDIIAYNNTYYLSTSKGLYTSNNNGLNWNKNLSLDSGFYSVSLNGNKIFAITKSLSKNVLKKSIDNGNTWVDLRNSLPNYNYISSVLSVGNKLYINLVSWDGNGNTFDSLYTSTNDGATWKIMQNGFSPNIDHYSSLFAFNDTIYIQNSNNNYFYFSNNDTILIPLQLPTNWGFFAKDNLRILGVNKGHLLSQDYGNTWNPANNGLDITTNITSLNLNANDIYATTSNDGVFKSDDWGQSWMSLNNPLADNDTYYLLQRIDSILFSIINDSIKKSFDNGQTWINAVNGISCAGINYFTKKGTKLFAVTDCGLYISANYGQNWIFSSTGLPDTLTKIVIDGSKIYVESLNSGLFVSNNDGLNWNILNNNSKGSTLIVSGNRIITSMAENNDWNYFYSNNYGLSWDTINTPFHLQSFIFYTDIIIASGILYHTLGDVTSYNISYDECLSWNQTFSYPSIYYNNSIVFPFIINDTLFSIWGGLDIWKRPLSDFVGINETTPKQLKIYPNPATNTLTLSLNQQQGLQKATVSIYDIQGKQLLQQSITETQTQIDISSFAKGIYIVKLQTDKEILQSKFVKE